MLLPLTGGELGHVVFDLDFSRHAVVKFNSERGVALDDRWRGSGRGRTHRWCICVLGGNLMDLWL